MKYVLLFLCVGNVVFSQFRFSGTIDVKKWQPNVYLSKVEDYRKIESVFAEQIIAKTKADSEGNFTFSGTFLPKEKAIYRIHVDNCHQDSQTSNHFNGHCENFHQITFIANYNDTIHFPLSSFESQMFCEMTSTNRNSNAFLRIDSLEQSFDIVTDINRKNHSLYVKKWYNDYMLFAEKLNEPLAELFIYSKISNKTSDLYTVYLNDLPQNSYFSDLQNRLRKQNPKSTFVEQLDIDLQSDLYTANLKHENKYSYTWIVVLSVLLIASILGFVFLFIRNKRLQKRLKHEKQIEVAKLSQQELKILELIKQNKSNKEISEALFISISTVKTHINNIYKKLQISKRSDVCEFD